MKLYRLLYDQVFLLDKEIVVEEETISSLSIFIKYRLLDKESGIEIFFRSWGEEALDQRIGTEPNTVFESSEGLCMDLKGVYLYEFVRCSFDRETLIHIEVDQERLEKLGYSLEYEIEKYYKDVLTERYCAKPVEISKQEFYDFMKDNLELFDIWDNNPTQSIAYKVEEIIDYERQDMIEEMEEKEKKVEKLKFYFFLVLVLVLSFISIGNIYILCSFFSGAFKALSPDTISSGLPISEEGIQWFVVSISFAYIAIMVLGAVLCYCWLTCHRQYKKWKHLKKTDKKGGKENMTTEWMEELIFKHFYKNSIVIIPRISGGNGYRFEDELGNVRHQEIVNHECDMLIVSKNKYLTEVEIKISLADLKADFKKKHQHMDENIKRMYYAFPEEMEDKAIPLIPTDCGILIAKKNVIGDFECRKMIRYREAKINKSAKPIHKEGLYKLFRLGYLRFWTNRGVSL